MTDKKETRTEVWGKEVKWNDDRPRQAFECALLGVTDKELAHIMNVDVDTIERWKKKHPEFLEKLQEGKEVSDAKVAEAFYKCATGFYYDEQHISVDKLGKVTVTTIRKYKPPEAWAAKQWLTVRRRAEWSDTQRLEITQTNINITKVDISLFNTEELALMQKMGLKQLTENAGNN